MASSYERLLDRSTFKNIFFTSLVATQMMHKPRACRLEIDSHYLNL